MTSLRLAVGAVTHRGLRKARNEDAVVLGDWASSAEAGVPLRATLTSDDGPVLLAVCDGMGGHAAGDEASALAADRLRTYRGAFATDRGARQVLTAIGAELAELGRRDPSRHGMGTTATVLAVTADAALVVNVGDSPAYAYAGGALAELTVSDELVRPDGSVAGSVLTQSLGPHGSDIEVHVRSVDLDAEHVFLLCSDGLSDFVAFDAIAALIAAAPHPVDAVASLLDAALAAGGRDNISIVIAAICSADAAG